MKAYAADEDEPIASWRFRLSRWCRWISVELCMLQLKIRRRLAIGCLGHWRDTNFWTPAYPPVTPETIMGSPVSVPMLLVDTACIPVLRWKIGVGTSAGRALEGSSLAEHGKWQLAQFMTQRGNIFCSAPCGDVPVQRLKAYLKVRDSI